MFRSMKRGGDRGLEIQLGSEEVAQLIKCLQGPEFGSHMKSRAWNPSAGQGETMGSLELASW